MISVILKWTVFTVASRVAVSGTASPTSKVHGDGKKNLWSKLQQNFYYKE